MLDEHADTVLVRALDGLGEVDRIDGLLGDRVCGRVSGRDVGTVARIRVEADLRHFRGVTLVNLVPCLREGAKWGAVDHHVQAEVNRSGPPHFLDDALARVRVPADDDILSMLNDGNIDARLTFHRLLNSLDGGRNAIVPPMGDLALGEPPEFGRRATLARELVDVHLRRVDLGNHLVEVVPHAKRHQRVGLTRRETHRDLWLHPEYVACELGMHLAYEGGSCELRGRRKRSDTGPVQVSCEVRRTREPLRKVVADLGKGQQQVPRRAGICRGGTRIAKRDLTVQRALTEVEPRSSRSSTSGQLGLRVRSEPLEVGFGLRDEREANRALERLLAGRDRRSQRRHGARGVKFAGRRTDGADQSRRAHGCHELHGRPHSRKGLRSDPRMDGVLPAR